MDQKRKGRIRHLGFSAHGDLPVIRRFLEAYGKDMEFGQIELNYFDWNFQNAKGKLELLRRWNIPVWVMEPVRGGQLAALRPEDEARLKATRLDEGVPAWAFRFLQSLPGVTVTLSGMSSLQQVRDNIATFEQAQAPKRRRNAAGSVHSGRHDSPHRRTQHRLPLLRQSLPQAPAHSRFAEAV